MPRGPITIFCCSPPRPLQASGAGDSASPTRWVSWSRSACWRFSSACGRRSISNWLQMPTTILGLATANTLAAALGGATHANTTVNGLGERAGNAAPEEVVLGLRKLYGFQVEVDLSRFPALSQRVAAAANRPLSWHKSLSAKVRSPTRPASMDGFAREPAHYQGVDPAELGRSHRLVLGKHSGTRAVVQFYRDPASLSPRQAGVVLQRIRAFVGQHKRLPESAELETFLPRTQRRSTSPALTFFNVPPTPRCHHDRDCPAMDQPR